jgi:Ca-activated chloride channel family protein
VIAFEWMEPSRLAWIALPIAALLWPTLRRGISRARAATFQPFSLLEDEPLPATWRTRLLWLPSALELAACALVVIAAAEPCVRVVRAAQKTGVDLALCVDVSSSMAQKDLDAASDRLAAAKAAVRTFVEGRTEDRIGLVRFSRYPDLVCPPTRDHGALLRMVDSLALVERDGPEDATGIGAAVARCVQSLQSAPQASRAVVLVTDGEENVAANGTPNEIGPLQAAQLAMRHGVRVHAIAVGAVEAGVAGPDTSQVEQLAQRTGGAFFRVGDTGGMARVWEEIDRIERSPIEEPDAEMEPRFVAFAVFALFAWLAAALLRRTWLEELP